MGRVEGGETTAEPLVLFRPSIPGQKRFPAKNNIPGGHQASGDFLWMKQRTCHPPRQPRGRGLRVDGRGFGFTDSEVRGDLPGEVQIQRMVRFGHIQPQPTALRIGIQIHTPGKVPNHPAPAGSHGSAGDRRYSSLRHCFGKVFRTGHRFGHGGREQPAITFSQLEYIDPPHGHRNPRCGGKFRVGPGFVPHPGTVPQGCKKQRPAGLFIPCSQLGHHGCQQRPRPCSGKFKPGRDCHAGVPVPGALLHPGQPTPGTVSHHCSGGAVSSAPD